LLAALRLKAKCEFIKWTEDLNSQKIPQFAGIRFAGHSGRGHVLNYDRDLQD